MPWAVAMGPRWPCWPPAPAPSVEPHPVSWGGGSRSPGFPPNRSTGLAWNRGWSPQAARKAPPGKGHRGGLWSAEKGRQKSGGGWAVGRRPGAGGREGVLGSTAWLRAPSSSPREVRGGGRAGSGRARGRLHGHRAPRMGWAGRPCAWSLPVCPGGPPTADSMGPGPASWDLQAHSPLGPVWPVPHCPLLEVLPVPPGLLFQAASFPSLPHFHSPQLGWVLGPLLTPEPSYREALGAPQSLLRATSPPLPLVLGCDPSCLHCVVYDKGTARLSTQEHRTGQKR